MHFSCIITFKANFNGKLLLSFNIYIFFFRTLAFLTIFITISSRSFYNHFFLSFIKSIIYEYFDSSTRIFNFLIIMITNTVSEATREKTDNNANNLVNKFYLKT